MALNDFLRSVDKTKKEGVIQSSLTNRLLSQPDFRKILPTNAQLYGEVVLGTPAKNVTDIDLLAIDTSSQRACFYMLKRYSSRHNTTSSARNERQLKKAHSFVQQFGFEPELYAVKYNPSINTFTVKRYRVKSPESFDLLYIPCVS
jgi:hypothetical protein